MLAVAIQPVLFSGYPLHVTFDSASTTGFPGGTVVKNPPANAEDTNSTPGSGRSSEEGNGNPVQYSCLGNSMDRRSLVVYSTQGHKRVKSGAAKNSTA